MGRLWMLLVPPAMLAFSGSAMACEPFLAASFNSQSSAYATAQCGSRERTSFVNFTMYYDGNGQLNASYSGTGANSGCVLNFPGGSEGFPSQVLISGPAPEGTTFVVACYNNDGALYGVEIDGCAGGYCSPAVLYE